MLVGALTHVKACRGNLETHNPAAVGNSSSSTSHIGCTRRSPTPAHAVWPMPRPTPVPGQNNLRLSQPANLKKSVCLSVGRPSHCLCREVAPCSDAALRKSEDVCDDDQRALRKSEDVCDDDQRALPGVRSHTEASELSTELGDSPAPATGEAPCKRPLSEAARRQRLHGEQSRPL